MYGTQAYPFLEKTLEMYKKPGNNKQRYSSPLKQQQQHDGGGSTTLTPTTTLGADDTSLSLDDSFMKTGDSTRSLLAPLYDQSFSSITTEFR